MAFSESTRVAYTRESVTSMQSDLKDIGFETKSISGLTVSGRLHESAIGELVDCCPDLHFVQPVMARTLSASSFGAGYVISEAIQALGADIVQTDLGFDGTGVTIGVMSDSFDSFGEAVDDIAAG